MSKLKSHDNYKIIGIELIHQVRISQLKRLYV